MVNLSGSNVLYRNLEGEGFADVTAAAGVGDAAALVSMGAIFTDTDNDGDVDILAIEGVSTINLTRYLNNGDGTFTSDAQVINASPLEKSTIALADYDNDGDLDIALAFEGSQTNGVEIWLNNGNADYVATNSRLEYTFNDLQFREFEVGDIDGDGWQDIILNPVNGNLFKSANAGNGELYLHNLIWKNNKGIFEKLSKEQKITFAQLPTYLKSFVINNKLKFIGIRGNLDGALIITEINPVF